MNLELILFLILAGVAAFSSIMVITRPNPILSAVFLILNFFALAGVYLLLNAQFLSVVQVIVYAGAIMILFLFVLMLINTDNENSIFSDKRPIKYFAIFIAVLVFSQIGFLIFFSNPSSLPTGTVEQSVRAGEIESVGRELYTTYILPFLIAGYLLLVATMGAIILAKKKFE